MVLFINRSEDHFQSYLKDLTKTIIVNNISLFFSVCMLLLYILAPVLGRRDQEERRRRDKGQALQGGEFYNL